MLGPTGPDGAGRDRTGALGGLPEGTGRLLRLLGHLRDLAAVVAYIGDLVRDDQVMLGVDRGLDIVADHARVAIDRASGPVSAICLSGAARTATPSALYLRICSRSEAILSFSRADLACANSPS
jgi:hypothetical protein